MDIQSLELSISCYAQGVYHEGSHNIQERIGIINVIRNRVRDGRWGRDVCSVVYASGQFIGVTDESHLPVNEKAYLETKLLVIDTIVFNKHTNPVADALYFHDDSIPPKKEWFGKRKKTHIGRMVFY
jgi:spore germination cell wall hydrolase CwlJ-like protein